MVTRVSKTAPRVNRPARKAGKPARKAKTAAPAPAKSTIWKKLERFDAHPKDGKLDFKETKGVFDA